MSTKFWLSLESIINQSKGYNKNKYRRCYEEWLNFLDIKWDSIDVEEKLSQVTVVEAQQFLEWQKTQAGTSTKLFHERSGLRSNSTIRNYITIIQSIQNELIEQGYISKNPFNSRVVKKPRKGTQKQPNKAFTQAQVDLIFSNLDEKILNAVTENDSRLIGLLRDKALLSVIFGGALRGSEALNLRIGDLRVDQEGYPFVWLRQTKSQDGARQDISKELSLHLMKFKKILKTQFGYNDFDYLFSRCLDRRSLLATQAILELAQIVPNLAPKEKITKETTQTMAMPYTRLQRKFRAICAECSFQGFSVHSCRATTITLMLDAGIPIERVAKFARHASINTTAQYDKRLTTGINSEIHSIFRAK